MGDIDAFIDHGFDDPKVFSRQFFASPDFTVAALRKIIRTGTASKDELAGEVARRFHAGDLDPAVILRSWAEQPRRWLSFKVGTAKHKAILPSATPLLSEFGEEGWHGPIIDPSGSPAWYIHIKKLHHFRIVSNQPRLSFIRWAVMAHVSPRHIALSWNNFSHRPDKEDEETSRNQFWHHIPQMFKDLENFLGGKWKHPGLNKLILHDLWDRYRSDPDYRWLHLRIRAERYGVALSARSAGVTEVDVAGLEALTRNLARSAAKAAKIADSQLIFEMEAELLRTLLREWGANSYAFQLDRAAEEEEGAYKTLFKGHCYFGLRGNLQNQDRLQHIECYQASGGSTGALSFFLGNL